MAQIAKESNAALVNWLRASGISTRNLFAVHIDISMDNVITVETHRYADAEMLNEPLPRDAMNVIDVWVDPRTGEPVETPAPPR